MNAASHLFMYVVGVLVGGLVAYFLPLAGLVLSALAALAAAGLVASGWLSRGA